MLTVGTIIREPRIVVEAFVDWHLCQGASEVMLCFDDPLDPAADALEGRDGVRIWRCDAAFWSSLGCTPETRFTLRQCAALSFMYRQAADGWFAAIDGDERLFGQDMPIAAKLDALPSQVQTVRITTAERVAFAETPDTAHFRLPMPNWARNAIYGERSLAMKHRAGLVGHMIGKSCTRTGLDGIRLRQHWPVAPEGEQLEAVEWTQADGAALLHLNDEGFETWRAKLPWRLSSSGLPPLLRAELAELLQRDPNDPRLREIHALLFELTPERLRILKRSGCHLRLPMDRFAAQDPDGGRVAA